MTREWIDAQLKEVTYEDAMYYYTLMKNQFISDYSKAIGDESQQMANRYLNDFISEIETSQFGSVPWELTYDFLNKLETGISKKLDKAIEGLTLEELEADQDTKYSDLSKKAQKTLEKHIMDVFDISNIHRYLLNELQKVGAQGKHFNKNDIVNWSVGYCRARLFHQLKNGNAQGFKYGNPATLQGYFREALVNKASYELVSHINKNLPGTLHTGSIKDNKGRDTPIDQYFDFLNKDIGTSFTTTLEIDDTSIINGYGAQVKSWQAPWALAKNSKEKEAYFIGNRADLYDGWDIKEQSSWIKGVVYLQERIKDALGKDNVMYITRNTFTWTADLIRNFRQKQYYLAFHFNKEKESTQTVQWERVQYDI